MLIFMQADMCDNSEIGSYRSYSLYVHKAFVSHVFHFTVLSTPQDSTSRELLAAYTR